MGVYEGRGQLAKIMKDLMFRWAETRGQWDDAIAKGFEQDHLEPLERDMRSAVAAMDHMAILLNQVKRECT